MACWLVWTVYLNHLASVKHNDVFIGLSVAKTNLLFSTPGFRFPDRIFKEMGLMTTIALVGGRENFLGHRNVPLCYR
jgi:hypothetical protein